MSKKFLYKDKKEAIEKHKNTEAPILDVIGFKYDLTPSYNKESKVKITHEENSETVKISDFDFNEIEINEDFGLDEFYTSEVFGHYNCGKHIKVCKDKVLSSPILINFEMDDENDELLDVIYIDCEKNSESSIILNYNAKNGGNYYKNGVIIISLGENAKLNMIKIQNLGVSGNVFESVLVNNRRYSKMNYIALELGGGVNALNFTGNLRGDYSELYVNVRYLTDLERKNDFEYNINYYGKNCIGRLDARGIVSNFWKTFFKDNLKFLEGSKKSVGSEKETCILFDKDVVSRSIPTLFCEEDDIEGEHGASVGSLDKKKLFYMETRGINKQDARKLIAFSVFKPEIETIMDEGIKENLFEELKKRIG